MWDVYRDIIRQRIEGLRALRNIVVGRSCSRDSGSYTMFGSGIRLGRRERGIAEAGVGICGVYCELEADDACGRE